MRQGTPGFVGARLRQAREARGITAVQLAKTIGVTAAAVSQYEKGVQTPAPSVLQRIFEELEMPMQFFLRPMPIREPGTVFFRSQSSATKAARKRASRRFEWLREIVEYLETFIELPRVNLPKLDAVRRPLNEVAIEKLAETVRAHWGLGNTPIANVVWLLETHGIIVGRHDFGDHRLDAFSEFSDRPYIVLNADKKSAVRSRFDAAHELGHLLMHRGVDQSTVNRSEHFLEIEEEAHRFAAALLFPEAAFRREVYSVSLELFRSLKMKWRVSIGMMLMRAKHLGMIDKDDERRLWLSYGRRGWRTREPLDDSLELEEPSLLRRSILLLLEKGISTPQILSFATGLNVRDIVELTGTPRDLMHSGRNDAELGPRMLPFRRDSGT